MLTEDQKNRLKNELEAAKNELLSRLKDNNNFGTSVSFPYDSTGGLSSYDNHPGDQATELYEREKDIALYAHEREHLREIDHALDNFKKGTYGKCEVCGQDIPLDRLAVIPTAVTCKQHTPDEEVSKNRPVEEEVLHPPFGKFEHDEKNIAGYDSEDAYQEVESYGNSQTPQDMETPPVSYNDVYMESEEDVGYVEDYENFAATDLYGNPMKIYPSNEHQEYEEQLDEADSMVSWGDLPASEKKPYDE
ncbi:TraR/DksA C4-type zinc finger protein [Bacillus gobiensis]|uniref:TraR/DksA C4-type zinc finger protein n=1 Tax=Bacillus gobiensis TaxID=1441095 RepID=UPI003D1DD78A